MRVPRRARVRVGRVLAIDSTTSIGPFAVAIR